MRDDLPAVATIPLPQRHRDPGAVFTPRPIKRDANPRLPRRIEQDHAYIPWGVPRELRCRFPDTGWSVWRRVKADTYQPIPPSAVEYSVRLMPAPVSSEKPPRRKRGARRYQRHNLEAVSKPRAQSSKAENPLSEPTD